MCVVLCVCVVCQDDTPDEWLPESLVAPDLVEDWSAGLERAPVTALLDVAQWGTSREYLVQWADGRPDSWEDEAHIPQVRGEEGRRLRVEGGGPLGGTEWGGVAAEFLRPPDPHHARAPFSIVDACPPQPHVALCMTVAAA